MAVKFTNNAATTLAAGINSSVTSISVTDGSVFPALTGSDHFYVTFDDTTNREIVKVTARSGNTLTVVRGQDNTTAQAFNSGDKAELRVVAALLEDITTEVTSTLSVDTFTGDGTTTAFTLSQAPSSEDNLIVFIEGAYQNPGDFVLSGTTLTLDEAPVVDRNIIVYHVKGAVSGNNLNQDSFTADGNTAAFTLSIAPIHENNTQVFIDGVYQQKNSYSISGTTLTLDANPSNGATVEVMTFTQTDVNTLPASFVSGLTEVTAVGADHFMIFDATDSALKKSLVSDVLESATSISTSADATAITIDSSENVTFTNNVTINSGQLTAGGLAYPTSDGTNGQVLTTDGAGTLSFADGGVAGIVSSADATAITIDSSENVGIGATSPDSKLHIDGNFNGPLVTIHNTGGASSAYAGLEVETSTTGTYVQRWLNAGTELMRVRGDGNVGIGTTDPKTDLHVSGNITIDNSSNTPYINFVENADTTDSKARITMNQIDGSNGSLLFYTEGSGSLQERMSITSGGNVGIGVSPSYKLHIRGPAGSNILRVDDTGNNAGLGIGADATNGAEINFGGVDILRFVNVSTERMRIDSSGRVGIGTNNPTVKLDVNCGADNVAAKFTSTDAGSYIQFMDNNATGHYLGTNGNNFLILNTSNVERMRINSAGQLLVGTSSNASGTRVHIDGGSSNLGQLGLRNSSATSGNHWRMGQNSDSHYIHYNQSGTGVYLLNGGTSWSGNSDETIKENIVELTGVLDKVRNFRCVEYNLISDETNSKKIGFIAQDWQEDYSQVISQDENGKLGMAYTETIPVLLKAIQEQQTIIEDLKARIETLENA